MRLGNHRAFPMRVAETVRDRATLVTQTVKRPPLVATWVALLTYC